MTSEDEAQHMGNPEYDYEIIVFKIDPIAGKYTFAAKAEYVVRRRPSGKSERITPPVGECWGRDADEARVKFQTAMEKWIQGQGGSRVTKGSA